MIELGIPKCPICGERMSIGENSKGRTNKDYWKYGNLYLVCWGCDLLFGYDLDYEGQFLTEEEAIEAWNSRAEKGGTE